MTVPPRPRGPAPAVLGLRQRLTAGLLAVGVTPHDPDGVSPAEAAGGLLEQWVRRVRSSRDRSELWLLLTMLLGHYPDEGSLLALSRRLRTEDDTELCVQLLGTALAQAGGRSNPGVHARVVTAGVVVDVDFCATNNHHTGIQRVVRETVPRWAMRHPLFLTAWWSDRAGYRTLEPAEAARVMEWSGRPSGLGTLPSSQPDSLVVPWRSHVLLPEAPHPSRSAALAALGRYSGNALSLIGYDCIPLVSPELVHPALPDYFMQYLSVVKHARTVAAISAAATDEFAGFSDMLGAQGLEGPTVHEVALPAVVRTDRDTRRRGAGTPSVVCVGSFEPRKNQAAVLVAAEQLWREGLEFELRFIGGGGYQTEFDDVLRQLREAGRRIDVTLQVSDTELDKAYAEARFTVFVSLHEGYGLPVTESLQHGTPVLTTAYGSTAEIAADGGCLTVDPRDPTALKDSMRRLLTDDALIAELEDAADSRRPRSWVGYADDAWRVLVEDVKL